MLQLLDREQWRGESLQIAADATLVGVPDDEVRFVAAAAACGAGEPKRALMILDERPVQGDGDRAAVERALRRLALTLEHNWFPGGAGAVLEPGESARFAQGPLPAATADVGLFIEVVEFLSVLPTLRTFAAGSRRGFSLPAGSDPVVTAESLLERLMAAQATTALSRVALEIGGLHVRSGRFAQAQVPLGFALQAAAAIGDVVGIACGALAQGDWSAQPLSHPELLGEDLEGPLPGPRMAEPDPTFAAERYAAAHDRFASVGAVRGVAAVALRRAGLAAASGDFAEATAELVRCQDLAIQAGDGASAALALVHGALIHIEEGAPAPLDAVAGRVAEWGLSVGSRSFVRGLARLCHARAQHYREDVGRARRALILAEALNDRIGAITEPALVRRELVEQYASVNYGRAAHVIGLLELRDLEQAGVQDATDWARLVDLVLRANADAIALADPDAIQDALDHATRVLALEPPQQPETAWFRIQLEQTFATSPVMIELYRGVQARARGDDDDAANRFEAALAGADSLGPDGVMTRAVVLGTMRRTAEARQLVEGMVAANQLPPDSAAAFLVRLEAYESAEQQLDRYEALALEPPPSERPWERPALRAEILARTGRAAEAVPIAEEAVARFEEHLAGLARDVLRTMASDSPMAAGLYTTAIRAHSDLAAAGAAGHLETGFALSDRSRGAALTDLISLDHDTGLDPATVDAVRAWLRAGAALARTIERVGRVGADTDADARRQIRAAERELDDTESTLGDTSPALLRDRRRLAPLPSLAETQERLDPSTLLIQYHAYDDQIFTWAVSRDSARVITGAAVTPMLTSKVRRSHRAIADPYSTDAERAETTEPLSELLLGPVADELSAHGRVVIVPHGPLAVLPFHVLPFDGSDLATTHDVSYLPAVSAASRSGRRTLGKEAHALIVGDPDYGDASPLHALPGARAEAVAIGGLRATSPLIGPAATRTDVIAQLQGADVVHLATHGLLVEGSPYSAELVLAEGDGLTVPDLMGLDTSISLAVLSACDSGRGRATAAGDVIGLTRSLMAAGAAELVVSLWPVDDAAACLTMVRFHEELLEGRTPAEALRAAAAVVRKSDRATADQAYRRIGANGRSPTGTVRTSRKVGPLHPGTAPPDFSHPYYWAPFVHIGF